MPIYKVSIQISGYVEDEIEADNIENAERKIWNSRISKYDIEDIDVDGFEILSEEPTEEELEEQERLKSLGQEKIDYKELEENGQLKFKIEDKLEMNYE
jgi:hypothetical protein